MPSLPVAAEGERGVSVRVCVRVGNGNDSKRVRSSRSSYGYTKRDSVVDFRRHLKCRRRRREGFTVRHATLATINCAKLPGSPCPLSFSLSLSVSLALFGLLFGFCLFACLKLIKTLCDCFAMRTSFTVPCWEPANPALNHAPTPTTHIVVGPINHSTCLHRQLWSALNYFPCLIMLISPSLPHIDWLKRERHFPLFTNRQWKLNSVERLK